MRRKITIFFEKKTLLAKNNRDYLRKERERREM